MVAILNFICLYQEIEYQKLIENRKQLMKRNTRIIANAFSFKVKNKMSRCCIILNIFFFTSDDGLGNKGFEFVVSEVTLTVLKRSSTSGGHGVLVLVTATGSDW
jgi:hypothetical protein